MTWPSLPTRWRDLVRCPWPWWPSWLCITNPSFVGLVFGIAMGGAIMWYLRPPPPWLEFRQLSVDHVSGDLITVIAEYETYEPCPTEPFWRTEVLTAQGRIFSFGRSLASHSPMPQHLDQRNVTRDALRVPGATDMHGWAIRVFVTCPGAAVETIASPPVIFPMRRGPP